jgi:hypothetical protein
MTQGGGGRYRRERAKIEANLVLNVLIGANNETVMPWFVLVVALLLDPAVVLLLLAAVCQVARPCLARRKP